MFVKLANGRPSKYPYTLGELRRDNPKTSFPKQVPPETLAAYDVCPVVETPAPEVDSKTHRLTQWVEMTEGQWTQVWTPVELPQEQAEANVRAYRNRLLAETDWMALSDNAMPPEWAEYRKALRAVTKQEGFPFAVVWPKQPE